MQQFSSISKAKLKEHDSSFDRDLKLTSLSSREMRKPRYSHITVRMLVLLQIPGLSLSIIEMTLASKLSCFISMTKEVLY